MNVDENDDEEEGEEGEGGGGEDVGDEGRRRTMTIYNNSNNRVRSNLHAKFTLWKCMFMGNDKLADCIKFNR